MAAEDLHVVLHTLGATGKQQLLFPVVLLGVRQPELELGSSAMGISLPTRSLILRSRKIFFITSVGGAGGPSNSTRMPKLTEGMQ